MKKFLLIWSIVAACSSVAAAEQWQILGTRPMGMGGAFVAVAQGPIAQYWNPGGLVKSSANVSGMEIPVGVQAEFTGDIVKNASQITDLAEKYSAIQAAQSNGGAVTADQMAAFVKTLALMSDMNKPGKGALLEVAGGVDFKFSKLALSVNSFTSLGLNPHIDTVNIGLANAAGISGIKFPTVNSGTLDNGAYTSAASSLKTALDLLGPSQVVSLLCGSNNCTTLDASVTNTTELANAIANYANANGGSPTQLTEAAATISQYAAEVAPLVAAGASGASYTNNTSNLTVAGASFMEIAAGYAWNADKWLNGLSLGGNVKLINGRTVVTNFRFLSESDTADAFKLDNPKSSWAPALDFGALWDVNRKYPGVPLHPKVGLVVRNINSPKFDTDAAGDYQLDRQARVGLALNPAKFWTLALDVDVTKNDTPVDGFDSRELAFGTEINIVNKKAFNIPLRAGMIKNIAEKTSKMAYTLGTGLNLLHMHFDVSGVISTQKTEIDGTKIPTKAGLAASFGLLF